MFRGKSGVCHISITEQAYLCHDMPFGLAYWNLVQRSVSSRKTGAYMTSQLTSKQRREIARDISYASSAKSKAGRAFIRVTENVTGRINLIRRAKGYEADVAEGQNFWQVVAERYGLSLQVTGGSLDNIPKTGPLIVIANHPYGILDGLMMGNILSQTRGDFRILANRVFNRAEDLDRVILPVSFDQTKQAMALNLKTRKTALDYLAQGGAIGIFPGGTVSTSAKPFSDPLDPNWRAFTARMIAKSGATVVPVYFEGANSRLFQLASRVHSNLRTALLIKEFRSRIDHPVKLVVGNPVDPAELASRSKDSRVMMRYLREQTYALGPDVQNPCEVGYEFEDRYKDS